MTLSHSAVTLDLSSYHKIIEGTELVTLLFSGLFFLELRSIEIERRETWLPEDKVALVLPSLVVPSSSIQMLTLLELVTMAWPTCGKPLPPHCRQAQRKPPLAQGTGSPPC